MKPEERQKKLAVVTEEISGCTACALHRSRTQTVPGDGAISADIMFIGEAPGYHEDQQGLPFVGRSGKYLEELLGTIGLNRQDVFITNVVKCRPPSNRDPQSDEIATCKPYLDRQIEIIDPLLIATLGRYSMARYFPNGKITKIHGQPRFDNGRIFFPLFHPAAVLRNPKLRPVMAEDFKKLSQLVEDARSGTLPDENNSSSNTPPQQLSLF